MVWEILFNGYSVLFEYANDSTIVLPITRNSDPSGDLVGQFLTWCKDNKMVCNPIKCKELVVRRKMTMYSTLQLTLSLTKEVYIRPPECHTTTQDVYIRPQTRSISSCPVVQDCMNKFNLVVEKGLALMLKSRRLHKVP